MHSCLVPLTNLQLFQDWETRRARRFTTMWTRTPCVFAASTGLTRSAAHVSSAPDTGVSRHFKVTPVPPRGRPRSRFTPVSSAQALTRVTDISKKQLFLSRSPPPECNPDSPLIHTCVQRKDGARVLDNPKYNGSSAGLSSPPTPHHILDPPPDALFSARWAVSPTLKGS